MKGGKTPIHIQRWAPADYHQDEHVRLLYARRDWRTLTFYRTFLDVSFMKGGDLPADPEALAASLMMPLADVRTGLAFCLDRLVFEEDGRLLQKRVRREVSEELEFRESQVEFGRKGGLRRSVRVAQGQPKASLPESGRVPQARRTPAPAPAPAPAPTPVACAVPPPIEPASVPPEQRAEDATKAEIHRKTLELGALLTDLSEHENSRQSVTAWCRECTSYENRDGTKVRGVADYRTLTSIDRLDRSIEDARWWLEQMNGGRVCGDPALVAAATGGQHGAR